MDKYSLLPKTQSAFREHHSTETPQWLPPLVRVHKDINVTALDHDDINCAHVLLDLSAAVDTVDQSIIIDVVQTRFDVGLVNNCIGFASPIILNKSVYCSKPVYVLQCSLESPGFRLGPKQFIAYLEDNFRTTGCHSSRLRPRHRRNRVPPSDCLSRWADG